MRFLTLLLALLLSGCAELQYYGHAVSGQLEVIAKRRPIPDVINDPDTAPEVVAKLNYVERVHDFAINELSLPDSESFRNYSDLERRYVLWNVFATPELSLQTKQWCYPFLGCLGYRSYFDKTYAEAVAMTLQKEGWDVHIAPSPAYSTRGFFSDPVYNPMLRYDDLTLAGILFHEMAHEKIFFKNDSVLNESFAVAVQNEGVKRWLLHENKPDKYADYMAYQKRDRQFVDLLLRYRKKLAIVYKSDQTDMQKRVKKKLLLAELKKAYFSLRKSWDGYAGFDHWFEKPLNNARLAPVGTYNDFVPAFTALLKQQQGMLPAFYDRAAFIAELPASQRRKLLHEIENKHP